MRDLEVWVLVLNSLQGLLLYSVVPRLSASELGLIVLALEVYLLGDTFGRLPLQYHAEFFFRQVYILRNPRCLLQNKNISSHHNIWGHVNAIIENHSFQYCSAICASILSNLLYSTQTPNLCNISTIFLLRVACLMAIPIAN